MNSANMSFESQVGTKLIGHKRKFKRWSSFDSFRLAKDSRCKSQEEVKSAFSDTSNVTLPPVVVYSRHADSVKG